MSKPNKVQIRSSTAEFLVFTTQAGEKGIEVRVEDETVWLTQKLIGVLFDVDVRTVSEHLQNIFNSGELTESAVIRKFRNTASDGKSYLTAFYNLDAIIAVVSSPSFRLQGRGRSPSGPKIQAQRAVKPKSKIPNPSAPSYSPWLKPKSKISASFTSHLVPPEPRSA